MRTVIVTDVRYRTAPAVIRPLARKGYSVVAVQTRAESPRAPAAFSSRYVSRRVLLDGSVKDAGYAERLYALCASFAERPVLFPIGADTLAVLSAQRERFSAVCDFLVAPPDVLELANDKARLAQCAQRLSVPTPQTYGVQDKRLPVILKPRCGEKLGLHAEERYCKAYTQAQFDAALEKLRAYDPQPVIQELVEGDGMGVCLVMDRAHRPVSVICHRRVREYPVSGGPSACCVSIYDETAVRRAVSLLQAIEFTGIAMVEFKGAYLLECNPRIWGSFPLTDACGSRFAENYVRAACGQTLPLDDDYRRGVRMRFFLNDTLATLSCLRHGKLRAALGGVADVFRAKEALFRFTDQKPFWRYLWLTLRGNKS